MSYQDGEIHGVGGWLAVYLFTLGVMNPGATALNIALTVNDPRMEAAYGAAWPMLKMVEIGLGAVTCLLCWYAVLRFFTARNWFTVRFAIGVMVFLVIANVLLEPLAVSMLSGMPVFYLIAQTGSTDLIRPFIYAGIWAAYLLNSERVANTYRADPVDEDISTVFE
jgi:hypothetical protein